jgi:uncharacterized membrane protein YccF (DUF307 family)
VLRFVGNVLWLVFFGFWIAMGYLAAALVAFVLIVTIPFGVAALRMGWYALWPFGRTVVRRADAGAPSTVGNVLWFVLAGLWLALGHLLAGFVLCLTIIGIPFGIAQFKLMVAAVNPLGKAVVDKDSAAAWAGVFPAPVLYPGRHPAVLASPAHQAYPGPSYPGQGYPPQPYAPQPYPSLASAGYTRPYSAT